MKREHVRRRHGGVVHIYQKYDPQQIPGPRHEPPDLVSPAFEHWLTFGSQRPLTPEELEGAIWLDPEQIQQLGPSLDSLIRRLRERRAKILATYETKTVQLEARRAWERARDKLSVPQPLREAYERAVRQEQRYQLERLWYKVGNDQSPLARGLLRLMELLGDRYEVEELASKYAFTGSDRLSVVAALEVKEELERIDELLRQLEEARKTARIGLIDVESLAEFAPAEDLERLAEARRQLQELLREAARQQGLDMEGGTFQLSPQAYRVFQGKLLEKIFSKLQAGRTGRHAAVVTSEGAVEAQETKAYEFGDSITSLDLPQTMINALVRQGTTRPVHWTTDDMVVHRNRQRPKCATVVIMDMSGSMRYDAQYVNVKRMALALDGLIRREYPGDYLQFLQMYTFAKPCRASEIIDLMPQPVTMFDPVVRLRADLSRVDVTESMIPPHFTNIQQSLQLARRLLASRDTPNRQIILITDGLPTAHVEEQWLYLLYPPDARTEEASMREGARCAQEGITLNLFLVPSWSQSEEDIRFAHRLAATTQGRVFFTAGKDLDRFVVWDYVNRRREIVG